LQPPSRFSEPLINDSQHPMGCDDLCMQNALFTRHARQREPERRSPARMRRQGGVQRTPRREDYVVGVGGRM
ncbi:MAG: hypothetical protein WBN38_14280, partial [Polyangiales bacterium]